MGTPEWKVGNEFAPYHPSASHCSPDYRDGWNHCYQMAAARLAALEADARRYQEKADAIHKYLTEKNNTALLAVITELSLDAQKRAALSQEPAEGG